MMSSSQQQDIDRETPPAVSNVELASTMIASIIGEQVRVCLAVEPFLIQ